MKQLIGDLSNNTQGKTTCNSCVSVYKAQTCAKGDHSTEGQSAAEDMRGGRWSSTHPKLPPKTK